MVVPAADDGSVDRTRSTLTLLLAVFVTVAVVCAGVLVYLAVSGDDGSDGGGGSSSTSQAAERDQVMAQADQFVLRSNTYGPSDLDAKNTMPGYADQVREVITDKFAADFDESGLTLAEQSVSQTGYARTVKLFATGVESMDDDRAVVLVAGRLDGSYPDPADADGRIAYEPLPFRFRVNLVKTEGDWLVDDFNPVTGETDDPTAEPSPSAPGSSAPTTPGSATPSAPASTPAGDPTTGSTP